MTPPLQRSFDTIVPTGVRRPAGRESRPDTNNVQLFELATAEEAAGLPERWRCRPYRGQPSVSGLVLPLMCRAMRLIADGALDDATEDDLGTRLGASGRHLRRLFVQHLGVTPDQLARFNRVQLARRLLDDTDLSIADVTFAAGFGSIRQFNRECQATFRATPSQLRARRTNNHRLIDDRGLTLRIPFQPPFDWQGWAGWTQKRAIGGVENVSAQCYRRTVLIDGEPGGVEIGLGGDNHLVLRAYLPQWKGLIHIVQRARAMYNLDADINAANHHLRGDPLVGPLVRRRPGIRPPGAWDAFEVGVEAIIGAKGSIADTAAALQQIASRYGKPVTDLKALGLQHTFPGPQAIAAADLDSLGLDQSSTAAIRALAEAAADAPDATDETRSAYGSLISATSSPTTESNAYLGFRLGEPDAFPSTSPALLQALSQRTGYQITPLEATSIAEAWRPWRAHATAFLLLTQQP
jgi:AraC family transcriptional regulator, regulatory protein of adaptative response / DNA-3-methyladenine glycosylase II